MNVMRTLILSLGLAVLIILGIVFVMLPVGWKFLPLVFMVPVLAVLMVQFNAVPEADRNPGEESTIGTAQDVPVEGVEGEGRSPEVLRRANRVFGPIIAGMIIDLVDFATFGPVGLVLGLPVGGLAGYWMGKALGFGRRGSVWCAVSAGVYCTIPGTEMIPLATIVGACARFREYPKRRRGKSAGRQAKRSAFCAPGSG